MSCVRSIIGPSFSSNRRRRVPRSWAVVQARRSHAGGDSRPAREVLPTFDRDVDVPEHIAALDASLAAKLEGGDADNIEYQFKVVYTLTNGSKAKAHFQFVQPESAEGKEIQNVLIKYKPLDEIYPLKPGQVRPPGLAAVFTISGGTALIRAAFATRRSPTPS